jgi:hypothetical protein
MIGWREGIKEQGGGKMKIGKGSKKDDRIKREEDEKRMTRKEKKKRR